MNWSRSATELLSILLALQRSSKEARQKLLSSPLASFDIIFNRLSSGGKCITAESLRDFLESSGLSADQSGTRLLVAMNSTNVSQSSMSEAK